MAIIHPFKAWRPKESKAEEVASVPYDVINTEEARQLAQGKPHSFLHVIRPEIDLPVNTDLYDEAVYRKGRENLDHLIDNGILEQEEVASLYVYRLEMPNGQQQTGLFTCVAVSDYDSNVILKHELTRPEKEKDRIKHIKTQEAHAEPVMLTFKDSQGIAREMNETIQWQRPLYDFEASDGVRHVIWKLHETDGLVDAFSKIEHLYVADGHHRCKSASEVAKHFGTARPEVNYFPAVLFPMDEMRILAYNRVVYEIPKDFLTQLRTSFELKEDASPVPKHRGSVSVYLDGTWYGIKFPPPGNKSTAEKLDVAQLQDNILEPLLGIHDQRKDKNLDFVGGIRGTDHLEQLVDSGKAAAAISMYPTSVEELVAVSDAGELMPPKSTWFEPKLRSGLLVHRF